MNVPLFFAMVGLLGAIYLWIGKNASNDITTNEDYFLMGRKLTFFPLTLTLLATQVGGGTLLGAAEEAYAHGWAVLFYPIGTCLGLFILGLGFGGKLRNLTIATIAEIFDKIYKSRSQRYIASTLSIVCMFIILVAQSIAARKFFVSIGADNPLIFIGFWSILIIYTVMGGLKAVVDTDIFQALFIVATLALTFFFVDTAHISPQETVLAVTEESLNIPWTAWILMPLLFMLIEQDMGQRCFAAKNSKVVSFSAITTGVILMASSSVAIYFGVVARNLGIQPKADSSILIEAVKVLTNPTIATIFMAGIFMAVISTADSLLCSISSNLSWDFLANSNLSDKKNVTVSKILTLVTGLLALGISFFYESVVSMLMLSYELSVSVLFVPIVSALLFARPSWIGAYVSMAFGFIGFAAFSNIDSIVPKEVLTICASAFGYVIGHGLMKQHKVKLPM